MASCVESIIYEFDIFRVDAGKRLLLGARGESIPLAPKAFDTLLYLVSNSGKVIDKDELMAAIWTDTIVEENNLNKNISALRRVLGESPTEHRFIATVPAKGYKFVADVRSVSNASEPPAIAGTVPLTAERTPRATEFRFVFVALAVAILFAVPITLSFFWPAAGSPVDDR